MLQRFASLPNQSAFDWSFDYKLNSLSSDKRKIKNICWYRHVGTICNLTNSIRKGKKKTNYMKNLSHLFTLSSLECIHIRTRRRVSSEIPFSGQKLGTVSEYRWQPGACFSRWMASILVRASNRERLHLTSPTLIRKCNDKFEIYGHENAIACISPRASSSSEHPVFEMPQ